MGQGYNDRLDETLGMKDGKESSKKQSMADRRHESEAMEKKDHGHKYGSDAQMSYRKDGGGNRYHAMSKVLKHMGGRGVNFDSTTDKGIKGLGEYTGGRYI